MSHFYKPIRIGSQYGGVLFAKKLASFFLTILLSFLGAATFAQPIESDSMSRYEPPKISQESINENYKFIGKLIETVPLTPDCGVIAWAIVQKFEVISTTFPNYDKTYVLIIQTCPEFLKKDFFQKSKSYEIDVATDSGVTFSYVIRNKYDKEKLPTFWTRNISKTD